MPPKAKKTKTKTKKKEVTAEPPRLGRGITRGASNRSRYTRGMMGADNSMMLRSVMNTVNNLPSYLQRHIDERMQKMHSDLLFKADEKKRNKPKPMDVDVEQPPAPMETSQAPPPSDTPMPQQPSQPAEMGASSSSRDPLMTRQVASSQTTTTTTQTDYVPPNIRYTRPQRITLKSIVVMPESHRPKRPRETQTYADFQGRLRETDVNELARKGKRTRVSNILSG